MRVVSLMLMFARTVLAQAYGLVRGMLADDCNGGFRPLISNLTVRSKVLAVQRTDRWNAAAEKQGLRPLVNSVHGL